jgi:hypothetical protein
LYARLLRLRHVHVGGLLSFVLAECTVAAAVLLALAELVSWWAVVVLPVSVAAMVKLNDIVTGITTRAGRSPSAPITMPAYRSRTEPAEAAATEVIQLPGARGSGTPETVHLRNAVAFRSNAEASLERRSRGHEATSRAQGARVNQRRFRAADALRTSDSAKAADGMRPPRTADDRRARDVDRREGWVATARRRHLRRAT